MKDNTFKARACVMAVGLVGLAGHLGQAQAQGGPPAAGAQAPSVQLYGTIDLGVGRIESQPPGPPGAPIVGGTRMQNGGLTTSFIGLRGTEQLSDGLRAQFQFESFVRADTGQSGRFGPPGPPQDPFFSRAAWVGLAGNFGDVKLGLSANPAWLSMVLTSAMGPNSLFSPTMRQQYNGSTRGYMGVDSALPNSISYTTPSMGGVTASVSAQLGEERGDNNYFANVVYRGGPLLLTAAVATTGHQPSPDEPAIQDQNWYVIGGSYDLKVVRLFAQYTDHEDKLEGTSTKTPHVGVTAPIGASGQLQVAWARGKTTREAGADSVRTTTSMAYIHNLSRRTSLYGVLANDRLPVGTANSYMVGVRHAF
jgi:predicted porin